MTFGEPWLRIVIENWNPSSYREYFPISQSKFSFHSPGKGVWGFTSIPLSFWRNTKIVYRGYKLHTITSTSGECNFCISTKWETSCCKTSHAIHHVKKPADIRTENHKRIDSGPRLTGTRPLMSNNQAQHEHFTGDQLCHWKELLSNFSHQEALKREWNFIPICQMEKHTIAPLLIIIWISS